MDKASIIKDAIDYIQELQEQERRMQAEVSELESWKEEKAAIGDTERDDVNFTQRKKKRPSRGSPSAPGFSSSPSIEVMDVSSLSPYDFDAPVFSDFKSARGGNEKVKHIF